MAPKIFSLLLLLFCLSCTSSSTKNGKPVATKMLLKNVNIIDGTGASLRQADIAIEDGRIVAIDSLLDTLNSRVIDLRGKTIIPALISAHIHIGTLQGTSTSSNHYTRTNILRQLRIYQDYGILHVLSMGTDRPLLFEHQLYDSLKNGSLDGARLFSAGIGFNVPEGATLSGSPMDLLYRPSQAEEVPNMMENLMKYKPQAVKIWVDDFGGTAKKMDRSVYKAIIQEAHQHQVPVVAHVYNLEDARQLVADGVDVLGHSIRDQLIDETLLNEMKAKKVAYIPTLTLDEFAFSYANRPVWLDDDFFKAALEPGVYDMLNAPDYQRSQQQDPQYARKVNALKNALENVKRIYQAGILVALGTDSGASPTRVQGFSEHRELALLVRAGLSPLQAISVGTQQAATVLGIQDQYGTIEKGKVADLVVLGANPLEDIENTQKIEAVLKAGQWVRGAY